MRDFAAMTREPPRGPARGIFIPRWLLAAGLFLLASLLAYLAFAPPVWTIQRLDSPDGQRTAVLSRTRFTKPAFVIKVKEGPAWHTLYISPPLPADFREDLGERLSWTTNSSTLNFRLRGQIEWHHDF